MYSALSRDMLRRCPTPTESRSILRQFDRRRGGCARDSDSWRFAAPCEERRRDRSQARTRKKRVADDRSIIADISRSASRSFISFSRNAASYLSRPPRAAHPDPFMSLHRQVLVGHDRLSRTKKRLFPPVGQSHTERRSAASNRVGPWIFKRHHVLRRQLLSAALNRHLITVAPVMHHPP
jgi:hypothetical protein